MQDDAGLAYLHLNPTHYLDKQLTIIDKLGREAVIDPNHIAFYIQRKGIPLRRYFMNFRDQNDLEGAKQGIEELFVYLARRSQKGILDRDPNFINNLGFFGDRAGNLDIGAIELDPLVKNPIEYRRRILDHMDAFQNWLANEYGELLPSYERQLEKL